MTQTRSDLNVKCKTIQLLEKEKKEENLADHRFGNEFLDVTAKHNP